MKPHLTWQYNSRRPTSPLVGVFGAVATLVGALFVGTFVLVLGMIGMVVGLALSAARTIVTNPARSSTPGARPSGQPGQGHPFSHLNRGQAAASKPESSSGTISMERDAEGRWRRRGE